MTTTMMREELEEEDIQGMILRISTRNYLDWVQAIERIFKLKEYNEEKSFKLAIFKLKGYAPLY